MHNKRVPIGREPLNAFADYYRCYLLAPPPCQTVDTLTGVRHLAVVLFESRGRADGRERWWENGGERGLGSPNSETQNASTTNTIPLAKQLRLPRARHEKKRPLTRTSLQVHVVVRRSSQTGYMWYLSSGGFVPKLHDLSLVAFSDPLKGVYLETRNDRSILGQ